MGRTTACAIGLEYAGESAVAIASAMPQQSSAPAPYTRYQTGHGFLTREEGPKGETLFDLFHTYWNFSPSHGLRTPVLIRL